MEESSVNQNFVTCLNWVRKGIAKEQPTQIQYSKEELKEIINNTKQQLNDINDSNGVRNAGNSVGNDIEMRGEDDEEARIIERYGLDDYEDSSDDEQRNIIGGFSNLVQHESNENDPYLQPNESDEESEAEDLMIKPEDNLMLVGRVQEDASSLEVWVYNNEDNYIHHDVYLPAFPICIETISFNCKENSKVNWCAIGDMTKDISLWDLDLMNELEPLFRLKGHKDSVLGLSWNSKMTNILASCSVDQSVLLWDLNIQKSIHKLKKFNDKVQSIQFNSEDEGKLLVGDCDGKISLIDCNTLSMQTYSIPNNEIEKVLWNPNCPYNFLASTDKGTIHLFDTRAKDQIQSVQAHEDSVTDLAFSSNDLFLSASADGDIKIWNLSSNNFNLIDTYTDSNVGKIFTMATNPDSPHVVAVGGDNKLKSIEVLDLSKFDSVKSYLNLGH